LDPGGGLKQLPAPYGKAMCAFFLAFQVLLFSGPEWKTMAWCGPIKLIHVSAPALLASHV
jgi:hypothetical protein